MRHPILLSTMVVGAVVSLASINGVFAASTDTALTGTVNNPESIKSGEWYVTPPEQSVDLQLASAGVDCQSFSDNLTTPLMSITDWQGPALDLAFCIKNVGNQLAHVQMRAINVVDTDIACSPLEATYDTTCGGGLVGELSSEVIFALNTLSGMNVGEGHLIDAPFTFDIAAGATRAFRLSYGVVTAGPNLQTDQVTWQWQFTATL